MLFVGVEAFLPTLGESVWWRDTPTSDNLGIDRRISCRIHRRPSTTVSWEAGSNGVRCKFHSTAVPGRSRMPMGNQHNDCGVFGIASLSEYRVPDTKYDCGVHCVVGRKHLLEPFWVYVYRYSGFLRRKDRNSMPRQCFLHRTVHDEHFDVFRISSVPIVFLFDRKHYRLVYCIVGRYAVHQSFRVHLQRGATVLFGAQRGELQDEYVLHRQLFFTVMRVCEWSVSLGVYLHSIQKSIVRWSLRMFHNHRPI